MYFPAVGCACDVDGVFASGDVTSLMGILAEIRMRAQVAAAGRSTALAELMILAGLRKLGGMIETQIEQMPILDDIMDPEVLGRERKRGIALGMAEGERRVVTRQLGRRFGPLPEWVAQKLENLSPGELERVEFRLLDAGSLDELFS